MQTKFALSALAAFALAGAALPGFAAGTTAATELAAADDGSLTAAVQAAIQADQALAYSQIKVQAKQGVVELSGTASQAEKSRALELAKQTAGVKDVKDAIKVKG